MLTMDPSPTFVSPAPPARKALHKKSALTGAGVKKQQVKKKPDGSLVKLAETALAEKPGPNDKTIEQPFRFMDLPGGIQHVLSPYMESTNKLQNCAMRSTSIPTTGLSKLFWCTAHALLRCALALA
jgi:hypothetical protein